MFTGIIEARATVTSLEHITPSLARLRLHGPDWLGEVPPGSSVAVSGVCLTAVEAARSGATFEVMAETLGLTTLGGLGAGDEVNLERALPAGGRLDGHVVQGHVDARGTLLASTEVPGDTRLRVAVPREIEDLVARKGSIALDGVSLTVAAVSEPGEEQPWVEVALIPVTLGATTLGLLRVGAAVNVEADVLARYAARRAAVAGAA